MRTVALAEVAEIVSGATPKTGIESYWGGDILWATPADLSKLQGSHISRTPRTLTASGLASCAATVLPVGSVLLSSRAPIGHVAINSEPMATNQGFKSLIPRADRLTAKYLYHWLRAHATLLQNLGNGATFKELSKSAVSRIEVPLPEIAEQRRIAAVLDRGDNLLAVHRRVLGHLDKLVVAVFYDMFGDPVSNSRKLPTVSIGSIADVMTGNSPSRSDDGNFGRDIEWIKSDNLGGDVATVAEEWLSLRGRRVARVAPAGSILVTCIAGSPRSIGKASLVDRSVAFNQQINAVLPSPEIDATFLLWQLKTAPVLVRRKSTGGMKGLVSKSSFQSIEVLLPPLAKQYEFAARASGIGAQLSAERHALAACDELFASLQRRAFDGEL